MDKSKGYSEIYHSETQKVRPLIDHYLLDAGRVIDIGCGNDKITRNAIGVDGRDLENVDYVLEDNQKIFHLSEIYTEGSFDVVFSSHCLEHLKEDMEALKDWFKLVKKGGFLILYLPDDRYYDNSSNPEHLQRYTFESFLQKVTKENIKRLLLKEGFLDVGHDRYSFCVVFQKER